MNQRFQLLLTGLVPALLLCACARQGAPTGGSKDTTPPKVDTVLSTRNFSTRFSQRRIELVFDEWITLSDVGAQVVVSPTLAKRPELKLKGKKVIVELPEEDTLRPNTTYTINFGTAVKDLHEGNPADNLRFVFSTGDYLDSLTVRGSVVDAFTNEPVDKVSVMLYENLADSVPRKERPYYFGRTGKTGQFLIENVRPGSFKVVAIEDVSGDLKWDGQNERIAFPDAVLSVNDTTKPSLTLKLFKNQSKRRLIDSKTIRFGLEKLIFTAPPDSVSLLNNATDLHFLVEKIQDTLLVWYDMTEPAGWQLYVDSDTVQVKNLPREDFLKNHKLIFADEVRVNASAGKFAGKPAAPPGGANTVKNISLSPAKPAILPCNTPVVAIDTSKWLFLLDSNRVENFTARPDSAAPRNLQLSLAWKPGKAYKLTLLPGAMTDFYGVANTDTLQRIFNILGEKQLGSLTLSIENLVPRMHYVLQLLNGQNVETERVFEAELTDKKLIFNSLQAATYTTRLIEDRNANGRWDSGDYFAHLQPEQIFSKKLDPLRANWELEATMRAGVNDSKWEGDKKK